jgi:Na+-transporting methylmalonyl-CoA/oxaloacetate decarboxylase gamma subunit
MFQGLFQRAETTIDGIVAKYMARALAAVPLLVACGFATAAATVKLVELYGAAIGCAIMAAVFAVLTLLTMAVVSGGQTAESASAASADASAEEPAQIGSEFEGLFTPELRAVLGATAPMALPVVTRAVMRNLPVLIMLALIIYVFSRFAKSSDETDSDAAQAMAAPPAA